ncbi:archaeoflavoprotein AfpA [Methanocella sp. CWC-04]|uniref:Archaeoflavoprotein AfpA n=1 Tax=Methanooceanicella nereidis TaxID=2052831 RepID=A0AAP2RD86_9EURY|nr:archaeoflavoprotein AfpA [Methanocella sp. CWC-04]MCD1295441.1 archaeoflavoprotein AfpA [Methanocella sp. CWC-04]
MVRIAWGITGCGDKIEQIAKIMIEMKKKHDLHVDIYCSKNAVMVLKWYKLWQQLQDEFYDLRVEVNPNAPFLVGKLQTGHYDMFLVAPMTANTTAKIAYGISDTLLSNAVSQGAKARVPIYVYPPDNKKGELETILPGGKKLTLYIRDVDVENVDKLRKMESISVLENVDDIQKVIEEHVAKEKAMMKTE